MNKMKINSGLAAVALVGGFISGWSTLLIVVALLLIFCDLNDSIKGLMVRVVTFYLGVTLFSTAWDLIADGVHLVINSFHSLIEVLNSYFTDPINTYKLDLYVLSPISKLTSLASSIISYLLVLVKFSFALAVLANQNLNSKLNNNFIVQKMNVLVNKVIMFVNSFEFMQNNNVQQQNVQPQSFETQQNNNVN